MGENVKNRPSGYWKKLENIKIELDLYIKEFGGVPNSGYFKRIKRTDIMCGIYHYGGYKKTADDLGVPLIQTVSQQSNCNVPINYWLNFDNLKKELEPIIEKYGTLPPQNIIRDISFSIEYAINKHGGFKKVRKRLNLQPLIENEHFQPHGYWGNIENVKKALAPLIKEYGTIPSSSFLSSTNSGLASAISKYHGGFTKLRHKLNLPELKRKKDWTRISIYREIGIKAYGKKCTICDFSFDVDVHHLDCNRLNNTEENLVVLCPNHHRIIHKLKISSRQEIDDYKRNYDIKRIEEYK